jgi:uncharacterized repeat protein (TIGR01451 family)
VVIEKIADSVEVAPGGTIVYSLAIANRGSQTAYDVVVVIDLASTKGDVIVEGQKVTAYPRELAPGETQSIRVTARVRPGAEAGDIPNTGIITTSTGGDPPGNNTSTFIVHLLPPKVPPTRLPPTAEGSDSILSSIPPAGWAGIVAVLLILLGLALRRGIHQPRVVGEPAVATNVGGPASTVASSVAPAQLQPAAPALPSVTLPAARPAEPLPPMARLDRPAALQWAQRLERPAQKDG